MSTTEYMYAKDVNGDLLHRRQPAGAAERVHRRGRAAAVDGQPSQHDAWQLRQQRLRAEERHDGSSWNFSQSLQRNFRSGLNVRGAWSYGESKTLVDPESTAATTFARVMHHGDPNNAGVGTSLWSPGSTACSRW